MLAGRAFAGGLVAAVLTGGICVGVSRAAEERTPKIAVKEPDDQPPRTKPDEP